MTPRQSTENREPHTIRAIHPHPARDRQADRREGDGNRKERKNGNHRTSEAANLLRPVRSSSSHPLPPHRPAGANNRTARNRHEPPHIDAIPAAKQASKQDGTLDAPASPLPVANRREAKRDEIDDIVSPASPTNTGKQATTPATAPPYRRDERDRGTGRQPTRHNETTSGEK